MLVGLPTALPSTGLLAVHTSALAAVPLATGATLTLAAGPQIQDVFFILGILGVGAFASRAIYDSLFIENESFKPPDITKLPSLPFGLGKKIAIPGITGGMPEDPVMQAELLRLKLQRALGRKDERAVRMIEAELADLMEREDLAFGSTNEEAEAEAMATAEEAARAQAAETDQR